MLIDRILSNWDRVVNTDMEMYKERSKYDPVSYPYPYREFKSRRFYYEALKNALCFDVTNVARYFWDNIYNKDDPNERIIDGKDIPNAKLPSEFVWMENDVSFMNISPILKSGTLLWEEKRRNKEHSVFALNFLEKGEKGKVYYSDYLVDTYIIDSGGNIMYQLSHNGASASVMMMCADDGSLHHMNANCAINIHFWPKILAISFMHCKNVIVQDNKPPEKLNKKRIKNNRPPMVTYKTLVIEPMKKILKTEGNIEHNGLAKALHICRGHFKDYSNSKGLFGKHKGLYWWDMHTRGNIERGAVVKDYAVNPPMGN